MKTVVIGASENPERYAWKATTMLQRYGHEVVPVGLKSGKINGLDILEGRPEIEGVDTVTMYVGPANQVHWKDYVMSLKPRRVILNPGTESGPVEAAAEAAGIEVVHGCTLVMLSVGQY